jgi:two-component system copper resistance phosphate regulon response regulator CusR
MSLEEKSLNILVVEDDPNTALLIEDSLERGGLDCHVNVVHNAKDCLELDLGHYDVILLDYELPDMLGTEVLKRIQEQRDLPVLMVTGMDDTQIVGEALKIGAYDYIVKSDQYLETLPIAVRKAVEKHCREAEAKGLDEELGAGEEK